MYFLFVSECEKILNSASSMYALDLHILGGVDASLGEFPHMVSEPPRSLWSGIKVAHEY